MNKVICICEICHKEIYVDSFVTILNVSDNSVVLKKGIVFDGSENTLERWKYIHIECNNINE